MRGADQHWEFDGAALGVWHDGPSLEGHRTAAIGAFSCDDAARGAAALREAVQRLEKEGFTAALGPIDGSTWARYRLVTDGDGRPPFLMEPTNPPHYVDAFESAGFAVVSRYFSAVRPASLPNSDSPPVRGIRLRNIDLDHFEDELARVFELSLESFSRNRFYTPITQAEFVESYRPVRDLVDPELVLMAEDGDGALQGFLFAVPNYAEGKQPQSVIFKTYASRRKGCGSMMLNAAQTRARDKGYQEFIHALIHDDNLSAKHSRNTGASPFRRYALWGCIF